MRALAPVLIALVVAAPAARAQDWLADDELRAYSAETKEVIRKGISKAPEKALDALLKEETRDLEALTEPELESFAKEALARLKEGREDGHLFREVRAVLVKAGALSKDLAKRVWEVERKRIHTLPERTVYALVDQVLKRVVIERLVNLRDRKFTIGRVDTGNGSAPLPDPGTLRAGDLSNWLLANRIMTNGAPAFAWKERGGDPASSVDTNLPIPSVSFWSDTVRMREVMFEKAYESSLGTLKVEAASVDGLAHAKAGKVSLLDEFGREVEGLGATFTARARLTGVRADVTSRDLELAHGDLSIRSRLVATVVDLASHVEANGTAVLTERGVAARGEVRAGAGVSSTARLPIEINLKVLTVRVIPYVSAHAGAMAEAHATVEVAWTGTVRFDVGASAATGVGVGAGVVLEVELGPVLRAALEKVIARVAKLTRPVGDAIMGRTWKGPAVDSHKLVIGREELAAHYAAEAAAGRDRPRDLSTPEAIAARYAPVLYQRVESEHDLIRRVDFDGDWNTRNNWDNAGGGDATSWVYWDLKETRTHYYVTYTLYHPRRSSHAIGPIAHLRKHENDLGGCVVVARKGAPRGREVELLITSDGDQLHTMGPAKPERWSTRDGFWNGELKFIDEADHPLVDLERTHLQVWVGAKDHDCRGFTGRDDAEPFDGDEGVVYVPTGTAEKAESRRDKHVGYALRPLTELLEQLKNDQAFTTDDTVRPRGSSTDFPRRMRGDEGLDDRAIPPWAWSDPAWGEFEDEPGGSNHGNQVRRRRDPSRTILEGDLFVDPARAVAIWFDVPADFSREYVRNAHRGSSRGLADGVPR